MIGRFCRETDGRSKSPIFMNDEVIGFNIQVRESGSSLLRCHMVEVGTSLPISG